MQVDQQVQLLVEHLLEVDECTARRAIKIWQQRLDQRRQMAQPTQPQDRYSLDPTEGYLHGGWPS